MASQSDALSVRKLVLQARSCGCMSTDFAPRCLPACNVESTLNLLCKIPQSDAGSVGNRCFEIGTPNSRCSTPCTSKRWPAGEEVSLNLLCMSPQSEAQSVRKLCLKTGEARSCFSSAPASARSLVSCGSAISNLRWMVLQSNACNVRKLCLEVSGQFVFFAIGTCKSWLDCTNLLCTTCQSDELNVRKLTLEAQCSVGFSAAIASRPWPTG